MRIAAIDLGSNSFHMLVAEVRGPASFETVLQEKMMIQLGKTALVSGRLDPATIKKGLQCLDEFRRLALARRVERTLAVATSAVREAENGAEFVRRAREETGIPVRVISGREEARLIHLAVSRHLDLDGRKCLLVDIGGGSVELIVGDAERIYYSTSLKAGFLRMHGRFITSDPIKKSEQKALIAYLKDLLAGPLMRIRRYAPEQLIATSGSMTSLQRLAALRRGEDPRLSIPSDHVGQDEIRSLLRDMLALTMVERAKKLDLDPLRAEYLPAALFCLQGVMDGLGFNEIRVSPVALREGLVYDFAAREKPAAATPPPAGDLRLQSVLELAGRCDYPAEHSHRVAEIAVQIFRQIPHLHGLGEREGQLLRYAGILHDIGYYIGYTRHHKHGYYLVMNCDLRGFTPEERNVLANLVRYHRRAVPSSSHAPFAALTAAGQKTVKRLAAILRIADALDRSHFSLVSEVRCRPGRKSIRFDLVTGAGPSALSLDLEAAHSHARYFEKVFGVGTTFSVVRETK